MSGDDAPSHPEGALGRQEKLLSAPCFLYASHVREMAFGNLRQQECANVTNKNEVTKYQRVLG